MFMFNVVGNSIPVSFKSSINTVFNKQDLAFKKVSNDVFVRSTSFAGTVNDSKSIIAQDMREYPVNQYYLLLLEEGFMSGRDKKFNDFGSVHDDEEGFFKWFSEEVSIGEALDELEKIPIDGPTGCRTIWNALKNKENAEALIPFMILIKDWAFNNEHSSNPNCMAAVKKLAISDLEKRLGVKIDAKETDNYHYEDYINKKIETVLK